MSRRVPRVKRVWGGLRQSRFGTVRGASRER
jgi:hypothetical protein